MNLEEFYELHGNRINQESERLLVDDFLYPVLGERIDQIIPQYQFIDSSGRSRSIDFVCRGSIAFEVNGETYHAEGIIPTENFDDNLYRQNEILHAGYKLLRFSYHQLQSPEWRPVVRQQIRAILANNAPDLIPQGTFQPNELQAEALHSLDFRRQTNHWRKAVVIMPTGTGKTILSALDAAKFPGRILFLVHRLDILKQTIDAYNLALPGVEYGILTGEEKRDEKTARILFASKDTLRRPHELSRFGKDEFDYIVVDEVHHGQSPSYKDIFEHFRPQFLLGMTATPDRMDRKDILELFDYQTAYEVTLQDAIERGYLVPYTYYGLTDDIDYSQIRFQNQRYRVDDLERLLIIPERNQAILNEYIDKGSRDKAIGFCVSIRHADRMAKFFSENEVPAAAIHSESPDRDKLIQDFRENRINVAFTVDLFNEGVDFPNVQVIMFLRPTESRTVFLQQLGRGLRLALGKERLRILDFIGNYKRANQIRSYLSRNKRETIEQDADGRTRRKFEFEYSTGCEVVFDPEVEEILANQDAEDLGIGEIELTEAYYSLAEQLGRKPTRQDVDAQGEYLSARYAAVFGSWMQFIRQIGAYTEASYHYPQGTHVGHILSILWYFGLPNRAGTPFDADYIRMRGGLGEGRLASYRRQVKYKLQAAMELKILEDDRRAQAGDDFDPNLTPLGQELRRLLHARLRETDLNFPRDEDDIPSTRMNRQEQDYNDLILTALNEDAIAAPVIRQVVFGMHAVQQMLLFLYQNCRNGPTTRSFVYENFFQSPPVLQFTEREGIRPATSEASRRRCPFLLNLLAAAGVIQQDTNNVTLQQFVLFPQIVRVPTDQSDGQADERLRLIKEAWPANPNAMPNDELSSCRELFGPQFLTNQFPFDHATFLEDI